MSFIFIAVPKTGSTSMSEALKPFVTEEDIARHSHVKAWKLKQRLGSAKWSNSWKFGFIRNPWKWYVSYYNHGLYSRGHVDLLGKPINPGKFEEWVRSVDQTPMSWLCERNTTDIIVNDIFKMEDLDFWNGTWFALDYKFPGIKFPHLEKGKEVDYHDYYTPELALLVAERCEKEIYYGNYRYE